MRFLIDASLPRSTARLAISLGDDAVDVRDLGMGTALDANIAAYAQSQQLCLLTRDYDFADVRNYLPINTWAWWCSSCRQRPPFP
jgi:predicted nuclease of predicted toxin-antitoxin system